jgi:hypothetical protein
MSHQVQRPTPRVLAAAVALGLAAASAPPPARCSIKSCAELAAESSEWAAHTFGPVCAGRGAAPLPGCSGATPWAQSLDRCTTAGLRLCTRDELYLGVGTSSGCGYNGQYLWSATECAHKSFYAVKGIAGGATECAPVNASAHHYGQCCADVDPASCARTAAPSVTRRPSPPPTPLPTAEPTPPPSPAPSPVPTVEVDCSVARCADLGWDTAHYGSSDVCGASDGAPLDGCSGQVRMPR